MTAPRLTLLRAQGKLPPVPHAAPPLRLLGDGLDALVIATRHRGRALPLKPPSARARFLRYETAAVLHPAERDPLKAELRADIGFLFHQAWHQGRFPNLRRLARVLQAATRCGNPFPRDACARALSPDQDSGAGRRFFLAEATNV